MSPKKIHDDFIIPWGMNLLLTVQCRNGLLNLEDGGRVKRIMNGLGALKRLLETKSLSLCTV